MAWLEVSYSSGDSYGRPRTSPAPKTRFPSIRARFIPAGHRFESRRWEIWNGPVCESIVIGTRWASSLRLTRLTELQQPARPREYFRPPHVGQYMIMMVMLDSTETWWLRDKALGLTRYIYPDSMGVTELLAVSWEERSHQSLILQVTSKGISWILTCSVAPSLCRYSAAFRRNTDPYGVWLVSTDGICVGTSPKNS